MSELTYLAHHGVKGQKHGERKYQNKDGSLTPLGRIHYGVGKAREAVRKKVKPTNAELNIMIRKQKSKNLNKQKREQLKLLKKGVDIDATSKLDSDGNVKGPHKKFSELSDKEIQERINRLRNEVTLAELEATKNLTPGKRMVYDIVKESGTKAAKRLLEDTLTSYGKKALGLDKKEEKEQSAKELLENLKAEEGLRDWYKEHGSTSDKVGAAVGKAVSSAGKKSGAAVGKAASNAGKKSGAAVGKAASSAGKKAGAAVGRAARAADKATRDFSDWASERVNPSVREVSNGREDERFTYRARKVAGSVRFRRKKKTKGSSNSTALAVRNPGSTALAIRRH